MKNIGKRLLTLILSVAMIIGFMPMDAVAEKVNQHDFHEVDNGYLSMKVSIKNGGFLIDTLEGDKLNKSDNNKFLIYPDNYYDTSFTSFRVSRGSEVEDYIFGRNYGFLGLESSQVSTELLGTTIISKWSVDDLVFTQNLTLLNQDSGQHGMVAISYGVENTGKREVDKVEARILMDTALGYQDHCIYRLGQEDGSYDIIEQEKLVVGGSHDRLLLGQNSLETPSITAYTVNATINEEVIKPEKLAFGHWNSLASTKFDFTPDETLTFTNPYNAKYKTADSAYAMYFDMGKVKSKGSGKSIGTYYGVFSNATVSREDRISLNFTDGPISMELIDENEGNVNEGNPVYKSKILGGENGDFQITSIVKNISNEDIEALALAVYPQKGISSYDTKGNENTNISPSNPYYLRIKNLKAGEERPVTISFSAKPLERTDYRKIEISAFDISGESKILEKNKLTSRSIYLLCPGIGGNEDLSFLSSSPSIIHNKGNRSLYLVGQNFNLLRDKSLYNVILRPSSGGKDVIVPGNKFILSINEDNPNEENLASVILDQYLEPGTWQLVIDWTEAGKEETTSDALRFSVSEDPVYQSVSYGVVTIEKEDNKNEYSIEGYISEDDYKKKGSKNNTLLEFRGDFNLVHEGDKIVKAEAVSLETVDKKATSTISISNSLDIEKGSLIIEVENLGKNNQIINTNINGQIYTTGARSKVWTGVSALTSIENGKDIGLLQYDHRGVLDEDNSPDEVITLLWPGAASTAQSIAGLVMDFRYCEFAQVKKKDNSLQRAVSFGAKLSSDFLLPSSIDFIKQDDSAMEKEQLNLARSNYSADQLREVQDRYAKGQEVFEKAAGTSLNLYIDNILFGGGFIGFNATIEVGLPSYADGLPSIEGILNLIVMNKEWELGIEGSADLGMMTLEGTLRIISYNGIPVPDNIYFGVFDLEPGINVDGHGIFWIKGGGGGLDKIYETIFPTSYVPPITLLVSTQFSLFNALTTKAELAVSPRHINASLEEISIARIKIIDYLGLQARWYPYIRFYAGIKLNVFDVIVGEGSLLLEQREDDFFWEGFAEARIQIPDYVFWPIGGVELGSAGVGINQQKLWAGFKVLLVHAGVTYYWGGDVDFSLGKLETPKASSINTFARDIPVAYDASTGRTLYMSINNARLLGENKEASKSKLEVEIDSDIEKKEHTFNIGGYGEEDGLMSVTFPAESRIEAETRAREIEISIADGTKYPLNWLDKNFDTDAEENKDSNATVNWNSDNKTVTVAITFTDESVFNKKITINTTVASDLMLFGMKRLAELDSISYDTEAKIARVKGDLDKFSKIAIYAVDENQNTWLVHETEENTSITESVTESVTVKFPETMTSGKYKLKAVATTADQSSNPIVESEEFDFVNKNQPGAPSIVSVDLGGDYSIDLTPGDGGSSDYDGYMLTIYEEKRSEDDSIVWEESLFQDMKFPKENNKLPSIITVGGQHNSVEYVDSDGNNVAPGTPGASEKSVTLGLKAGESYKVGISSYKDLEGDFKGEVLPSKETLSEAIEMKAPTPTRVILKADNSKGLPANYLLEGEDFNIDTVASSEVTIYIRSQGGELKSGRYSLDEGEFEDWNNADGPINLSDLSEGSHKLVFRGQNMTGDGVQAMYQFTVDTLPPRLMISSPAGGGFYEDTLTISGISDKGAKVYAQLEGRQAQSITVGEDGTFVIELEMDTGIAYESIEIYAQDPVGNKSKLSRMEMTNKLLGNSKAEPRLFLDGEDVTNKSLGEEVKGQLTLKVKVNDETIDINSNSPAANQINWDLQLIEGSANLSESGYLDSSKGANGIVLANLGQIQAAAVLSQELEGYIPEDPDPEDPKDPKDPTPPIEDSDYDDDWDSGDTSTYKIDIYEGIKNGNVTVSPVNAKPGMTAILTVVAKEGYKISKITVTDARGNIIKLIEQGKDKYSFIMPASQLKVDASFEKIIYESKAMAFTDVNNDDYFKDAVDWAVNKGITSGTSSTSFSPHAVATRAEALTFLWRAMGSPEPLAKESPFDDIKTNDYYYKAVLWAVENGITRGTSIETFSPDGTVARNQIIVFQWRAAGKPTSKASNQFTDVKTTDYFADAVSWAVEQSITNGTSKTTFGPADPCTRAQTVTLLYNYLGK